MHEPCPRTEELSEYLDDQSVPDERARFESHLGQCPGCAEQLAALRRLRAGLRALPEEALGFDLSEVIRGRIAADAASRRGMRRRRGWRALIPLVPLGVGAAAAVSFGLFAGLALTAGSGVAVAPRVSAMAVFDPTAPGGLCLGADGCHAPIGLNGGVPR